MPNLLALVVAVAQAAADTAPISPARILAADAKLPVGIQLLAMGDKLVQVNLAPAAPLIVRDVKTGRVVRNVGTRGQGPNDFGGVWYIDAVEKSQRCWVWDLTRNRMALVDAGVTDTARSSILEWVSVRSDAALTAPVWAGDTLYSPGFFHSGRLAAFSRQGKFLRLVGSAPSVPGEPTLATQQAYHAIMRGHPDRRLFVLGVKNAGVLQIIRPDGSVKTQMRVPDEFAPVYEVVYAQGEPKVLFDDKSRNGYLDIAVDSTRIYALFSGTLHNEGGFFPIAKTLHVFDWNGNLRAVRVLPSSAIALTIADVTNELVVMHTEPTPRIAAYKLPLER